MMTLYAIRGYAETDGYSNSTYTMKREEEGMSPKGNRLYGQWVLRTRDGTYVDHDRYRFDLAERNDIWLGE